MLAPGHQPPSAVRQHKGNKVALQLKKMKEMQEVTNATAKSIIQHQHRGICGTWETTGISHKICKKITKQLQEKVTNITSQLQEIKELLKKIAGAMPVPYDRTGAPISLHKKKTKRTNNPLTCQRNPSTWQRTPTKKGKRNAGAANGNASCSGNGKGKPKNG